MKEFQIKEDAEFVELVKLLKLLDLVNSGGEAKVRIHAGEVSLNGEVETRKRKKLYPGDLVLFDGTEIIIK